MAVLPLSYRVKGREATFPAAAPRDGGCECLRNTYRGIHTYRSWRKQAPLYAPEDVVSPSMFVTVNSGCEGTLILPWPFVV